MLVQRAYKTELDLNNRQMTACRRHAGAARWAYNWGLRIKQERYKATKRSPTAIELRPGTQQVSRRRTCPGCMRSPSVHPKKRCGTWMPPSSSSFDGVPSKSKGSGPGSSGIPGFKTKKTGLGSFRLTGSIVVSRESDRAPSAGSAAAQEEHEYLPPSGVKILSATVSEQAGHWYVPCRWKRSWRYREYRTRGGYRSGDQELATLSDGTVIANPRHLKRRIKKLKRLQRVVSRRKKGSHNPKKAARKLARLHRQITNQRRNTLHQVTTRLAKTKAVLVIENLNVSGMLKNHHLAQAIGDVGFSEFKRQLLYKASWYGSRVILADRWEPSSKRCSGCGWVDAELTLSDRIFHCEQCGLVRDRDLNAAINLSKLAGSSSDSQTPVELSALARGATSCETGGEEAGT